MKAVLLLTFALFYIANCREHPAPQNVKCVCDKCPGGIPKPKPGGKPKPKPGTFSICRG